MKKLNNISLIDIILVTSPIIDVLICMLQKFTNVALFGTLLRGGLLLGLLVYVFIFKKEHDKRIIRYITSIFLYAFIFVFDLFLINNTIIVSEIVGLIKYIFYPLTVATLLLINNKNKENVYNSLFICGIIYAIFLLVPLLFNINFKSYSSIKVGNIGWFFSANEISSIVSILSPFVFIKLYTQKDLKFRILSFIISSLYIYTIYTIGTKTVIASVFITLFFLLLKNVYDLIKKRDYISPIATLLLIGIAILCFSKSSSLQNIKVQHDTFEISDIAMRDSEVVTNTSSNVILNNYYKTMYDFLDEPIYITNKYLNLIFSSRDVFLMEHISSYKRAGLQEKLFGMGQIYNEKSSATSKLVEIDFFDIFFNYGIIGFVVYFSFIIYLLFIILKYLFKNLKEIFNNFEIYAIYISIIITFMLSCIAGHVIGAPAVSLIAAIILSTLGEKVYKFNYINEKIVTKPFIIKLFIAIIVLTLVVLRVNKISNSRDISNEINLTIKDHSIVIDDDNYSIKKIQDKEITSDYATDKLSYYRVFYKRKSVIKLLVVNRSFQNSDIKMDFIVGKNYNKDNVLININYGNNVSANAYIYDLINYNYDGVNHSIIKDLNNHIDINKNNKLILGSEQYFDLIMVDGDDSAYDLLNNNTWLSFDGRYSLVNEETIPHGSNVYVRNCYNDIEDVLMDTYEKTDDELLRAYIDSYIHSLINYLPRYKDSVWLNEYTYKQLSDYGIKSFYVDVNANIKLSNYLKRYHDASINELGQLLGYYLIKQDNNGYIMNYNEKDLPLDYYNNSSIKSISSLEGIVDIIYYLSNSKEKEQRKLGIKYLNNLGSEWIQDNNNLYKGLLQDEEFLEGDSNTIIIKKLLLLENLTNDKNGRRIIHGLVDAKLRYLRSENYVIEDDILKMLKVGGYIE